MFAAVVKLEGIYVVAPVVVLGVVIVTYGLVIGMEVPSPNGLTKGLIG